MSDHRWMLIKGSEDGNPITWLTENELRGLLHSPADWGVAEFATWDDIVNPDPNYWPDRLGLLVRFEVVTPEPAGVFRLPNGIPMPDQGFVITEQGPIRLGDVIG